jgi:predicted acyltransferase
LKNGCKASNKSCISQIHELILLILICPQPELSIMNQNQSIAQPGQRLLSLDFMRGLIMVLLMLESTQLYDRLSEATESGFFHQFMMQFFHHPWHGLHFWDLIQPGFMFIAGTALAYSLHKQQEAGIPWRQSFIKVLKRSWWLFFWGVLNYAVGPDGLSFKLWNVLTQLAFTTLVAFLIFYWPALWQVAFSAVLLLLTELMFRLIHMPGFDQPFTDQHNFGNFIDLILMNKINSDGWVAINCIPTACHTIWGALAGKLLFSDKTAKEKINTLLVSGVIALILGYGMDLTVTPIIKRIATSSFVLTSGGWCLLALALFYWWIDLKNHRNHLLFFTVVGMNSIFIYLFFGIIGSRWFNGYIDTIAMDVFSSLNIPLLIASVMSSLCIFALEWYLCWFLYKNKIFIKI